MGLFSLLEEKRDSKKIAVIDRGISYTYAGLWNDVLETKHLWDERISRKNVLIYLDNSYEFILSYFAAVSAAKNVALSSKKLSRKEQLKNLMRIFRDGDSNILSLDIVYSSQATNLY